MSQSAQRVLTTADLAAAGQELPDSFGLDLASRQVQVETVLRWLPGKRLTAIVASGEVLKLFVGGRAQERLERERFGLDVFAKVGLPTPEILSTGEHWLMIAALPDARHAQSEDAVALSAALAALHDAGYIHGDLHVGNFLSSKGELHFIDGDSVVERPVPVEVGLSELATLLVQFTVTSVDNEQAALSAYLQARSVNPKEFEAFAAKVKLARRKRVAHYLAKSRRNCTEFVVEKQAYQRMVCRRLEVEVGRQFATSAERYFDQADEFLKEGNSATVVRVTIAGRSWVAKRYNIKSLVHRLKRVFKRRPRLAWESALTLEFLGIPTARAITLIETGPRLWPGPAYLLTEDLGDSHLAALTEEDGIEPALTDQLVALLKSLRRAGLVHGDFKSTNLLLNDGQLHLIDVDGVASADATGQTDARRLLENWPQGSQVRAAVSEAVEREL